MVAHERNKSSQGQEDITPDDPLKEAVVGLQYNASVPKPNIKVIFVQTTLIFFADRSQHPYGILRPFFDPVAVSHIITASILHFKVHTTYCLRLLTATST